MIKVRGWQVSPAEIEACILMHPEVLDIAVVGIVADLEIDETPVAFAVAKGFQKDRTTLEQDIKAVVDQNLASYKAIGRVVFVDVIPRTVSGKVLRRILKEGLVDDPKTKSEKSKTDPGAM